jgi:uncharacterized protein
VPVDPFNVPLGDLREQRAARHVVRRGVLADALVADVDSRVPAGAEAVADVVLEAFDGGVAVSGTVSARWEGECRRCLCPVDGDVVGEVKEIFRRGGGPDEGTYPLAADHIGLREMVLDALFAALPLLPLCRPSCRGLCPRCGAELNVAPCDCEEGSFDPRWSGLDVLRAGTACGEAAAGGEGSAGGEGPIVGPG